MDLKAKVEDLNQMVLDGKMLEAFEKYYADNVIMQEINMDPVSGKDANREREKKWLAGITEFRGVEVKNVAVGDDVTMVEWFMDYSHKVKNMVMLKWTRFQCRPGKMVK